MILINDFKSLLKESIDYVVFDLETTGLSNRTDRIVEIGAIKYSNGIISDTFVHLINPGIPIPSKVSAIHGIYDKDVKGKPEIDDVLPEFLAFIEDSVLVAHNANFDVGFIKKALGRGGYEIPEKRVVDTIRLAKKAWPGRTSYSQSNLASFLSIEVRNAHRAEDDCRVCLEILNQALKKIEIGENNE